MGAVRWRVVLPDPWVWEGWMFDRLRDAGCALVLGAAADDTTARALSAEDMGAFLADADGVIVHSREAIPSSALEGAERLRVISKMGIGVDRIDHAAAAARGVVVTNTPVPHDFESIAEGALTLLLALLKQLPQKQAHLRAGRWRDRTITGQPLRGTTVGLVGFGRVGRRVAHLLRPWEATLLVADPQVDVAVAERAGGRLVELEELLDQADVVSLHAIVTDRGRPLLGAAELRRMRPGAFRVNTARGALVDEVALVAALDGHLGGAALDVFAAEPLPADHPLRELDNVILTPHAIGTSRQSQRSICETAVQNCLDVLGGRWPRYVVNPEVRPRWELRATTEVR